MRFSQRMMDIQGKDMSEQISLDELWNSPSQAKGKFDPEGLSDLPEPVTRYLNHAITPDTPLANAVRLKMHGEIKVRRWAPFQAEQVIHAERGMIWRAKSRVNGLPVRGADRLVDGEGSMDWRLFGILPVITASGNDVTRSAAGRLQAEFVWLPSALAQPGVKWTAPDGSHIKATLTVAGNTESMTLVVDESGRPMHLSFPRWGNPGGGDFRSIAFGAIFEEERSFGAFTIPTVLRVGWYFGTDRFETEGEFFRCTIDEADYR
jgi:hypothetical protein